MEKTLIVVALFAAGLVLSRSRFARELNSRRFMPVIYAAAAVYLGVRAYEAASAHTKVWPSAILAVLALTGTIDSARASGILKRP
jgi:hypothetical protein